MSIISDKVKITQVLNPSKFFFCSLNDSKLKRIIEQENDLQKVLGPSGSSNQHNPKVGEICAFYHKNSMKWIKVKVEEIKRNSAGEIFAIFLWAIDYGVALSTDNLSELGEIPEKFQIDHGYIRTGCLNLVPSKIDFDLTTGRTVAELGTEWSPKATELFKKFVHEAKELSFTAEEVRENTSFGDVEVINDAGKTISLCGTLTLLKIAAPLDMAAYSSLETPSLLLAERWNVSDGINNGNELKLKLPQGHELSVNPVCNFEKIFENLAVTSDFAQSAAFVQPAIEPVKFIRKALFTAALNEIRAKCNNTPKNVEPEKEAEIKDEQKKGAEKEVETKGEPKNEVKITSNVGPAKQVVQMQNPIASLSDVIRLFVHGKYLQKPLNNISEALFPDEIHKNLRAMKFQAVFRTQAHAWPHVLEGRSMFIINSERTGKTFTYLPALLSNVLYEEESVAPKAQGPVGIIVARSSREVELIFKYCRALVPREKMEIITAFGKWNCENKKVSLLNGCDLLITTPPCFSRLAQSDVIRMFDKKRIKFLVLDGLDKMHASFENEMKDIIRTCTKGSEHPELNPQLIVTSTSWMEYFRGYMALTCDPVMIFGSFVEAALFAKCQFTICKKSHEEKLDSLWKQLNTKEHLSVKTLIAFNNKTELSHVASFLKNRAFGFLAIDEFSYSEKLEISSWLSEKANQMMIMLITDEALSRLVINCVQNLVHFSLPDTMTKFSQRFATMFARFHQAIDSKTKGPLKTLIMIDEENGIQIPRLVDFLKSRRILNEVPEEVNKLVTHLIEEREMIKRDPKYDNIMPICSSIYLYGVCPKMLSCKNRHAFTSSDKPINIPCDGLVKFQLVGTKSPVRYYIKVLAYQLANEKKWISCVKKIERIEESLESLQTLMQESAMIQVGVKTDEICAVFVPKLVKWCRCKVLEKEPTERSVYRAIVHLIDIGETMTVKATDLMSLPDHLKSMDPLLTELRIVDIVPYDLDSNFDHETTCEVKKLFNEKPKPGDYNLLKIEFVVQNIIFAKTFEMRRHIEELKVDITKFSLKATLLKENFCLRDRSVSDSLKMLLKRANIYVPQPTEPACENDLIIPETEAIKEEAQPRWKNLTVGCDYQVFIKEFSSPDLFYTRLDDSDNKVLPKLMRMVGDCESRVAMTETKNDGFCLVGLPNEKAQRGIIKKVKQTSLNVFLLDEGQTIKCKKSDVYELPVAIINAVPFQSIQCRLVGVKPKSGISEWNTQSSIDFSNFVTEICHEKTVKLRVIARHKNKYDVALFHPDTAEPLHKVAVQKNLADPTELVDIEMSDKESETSSNSPHEASTIAMDKCEVQKNLMELLESKEAEAFGTCDLFDMLGFPRTARLLPPEDQVPAAAKIDEIPAIKGRLDNSQVEEMIDQSSSGSNTLSPSCGAPSTLAYMHKHPKIEWRQDESMVLLNIPATDCVDYSLQASDSSLKIFIKYEGSAYEYTALQLYGCVEPEIMSHEKSGGKIIVRIIKSLTMSWPRLTKTKETNRFITFSHDPLPAYLTEEGMKTKTMGRPTGDSDEEEDLVELSSDSDDN